MTLDNSRIDKIFWLFGAVLPIPENDSRKKALEAVVGGKLEVIIPQFMKLLSLMLKENPEAAEMWFTFFSQSIAYIKNESDKMPDNSMTEEELERFWKIYGITHKYQK